MNSKRLSATKDRRSAGTYTCYVGLPYPCYRSVLKVASFSEWYQLGAMGIGMGITEKASVYPRRPYQSRGGNSIPTVSFKATTTGTLKETPIAVRTNGHNGNKGDERRELSC